jgi:hypothetical protein
MQVLVGFVNFYRHFVKKHTKVTSNRRFAKEIEREVGVYWGADIAIQKLKRAFIEAPILQHFEAEKPITLQTDASGFAIAGILNQFDGFGVLRPTSFYSRKCNLRSKLIHLRPRIAGDRSFYEAKETSPRRC